MGKTTSGFEYSIPESHFDDMRLVDALSELTEDENALAVSRVVLLLLGKEQRDALYKHLQREDGTVSPDAVVKDLLDIINSKSKNSSSLPQ